jgi:hypothetical protein
MGNTCCSSDPKKNDVSQIPILHNPILRESLNQQLQLQVNLATRSPPRADLSSHQNSSDSQQSRSPTKNLLVQFDNQDTDNQQLPNQNSSGKKSQNPENQTQHISEIDRITYESIIAQNRIEELFQEIETELPKSIDDIFAPDGRDSEDEPVKILDENFGFDHDFGCGYDVRISGKNYALEKFEDENFHCIGENFDIDLHPEDYLYFKLLMSKEHRLKINTQVADFKLLYFSERNETIYYLVQVNYKRLHGMPEKEELLIGAFKQLADNKYIEIYKSWYHTKFPQSASNSRIHVEKAGYIYEKVESKIYLDGVNKWNVQGAKISNPICRKVRPMRMSMKGDYKEYYKNLY